MVATPNIKTFINSELLGNINFEFKVIHNITYIGFTGEYPKTLYDQEQKRKENIVKQRIATAVDILTGILKPANFKEKIQAHIDLYKYKFARSENNSDQNTLNYILNNYYTHLKSYYKNTDSLLKLFQTTIA